MNRRNPKGNQNSQREIKMKTKHQNLRNAANIVHRRRFIAVNAFIKKDFKPITSTLTFHLKTLEK